MQVIGLDGFGDRWVAVTVEGGRFSSAAIVDSVADALASFPSALVIAVDIPIGLPEGHGRECDRAAQAFIGPRRSSVFLTLPRAIFEAPTHEEAVRRARSITGHRISAQSYSLGPKILEAEQAAAKDDRIVEVHPEVSFAAMAGEPLSHSKKTWTGQARRRALLLAEGLEIPNDLGEAGQAGPDDVLDAAAAAWTAHRKALGKAKTLPHETGVTKVRISGVIWY